MSIYATTMQEVLESISRHCPESMSAYFQCHNRKNELGEIHFTRELVEVEMSEDFRQFRNRIKTLARENLLEWHPTDDGIHVTLAHVDDD